MPTTIDFITAFTTINTNIAMKPFVITTKEFGRIQLAEANNGNKQLIFLDNNIICDAIIDEKRNMHAKFVYDGLKEDEVYLEWLDCYSNALLSTHKIDDIFNLDKLETELLDGYKQVVEQGFGVDSWADDDYQDFDD